MKATACLLGLATLPVLATAPEKPASAPMISLADVRWGTPVNGPRINREELKGKVVIVEEWGVHCGICIAGMPNLAKLAKAWKPHGLVVIGLELQGGSPEQVHRIITKAGVEYPILSGGSTPGSTGALPYVCVFDSTGRIAFMGHPHDPKFGQSVMKAMGELKAAK